MLLKQGGNENSFPLVAKARILSKLFRKLSVNFQKIKEKTKKCKQEWTKVAVNYVSKYKNALSGYN